MISSSNLLAAFPFSRRAGEGEETEREESNLSNKTKEEVP
jgi:hypothetical protein